MSNRCYYNNCCQPYYGGGYPGGYCNNMGCGFGGCGFGGCGCGIWPALFLLPFLFCCF